MLVETVELKGLDLIKLDAWNNSKIKKVSFMKNLKELDAGDDCAIDQKGIQGLDLIKLDVGYNNKIKDVSFMMSLKELYARRNSGID